MNDQTVASAAAVVAEEHWAKKGKVDLYLYRKQLAQPAAQPRPVLFLVHGSSFSARTSYDLEIPGHGEYSLMNVFARHGFDVWTMDHEGYGRSTQTDGFSYIADGVEDLKAAMPVVEAATGRDRYAFFGTSSGALRAAAFANAHPARVEKLALAALVWTGEGSPTLKERAKKLDQWKASNMRPVDRDFFLSIFTRDKPGTTEDGVAEAMADTELAICDRVPTGTYYDMCARLPLCDPTRVKCPVLIIRSEHDGIATDEDLLAYFKALPNRDKQFVIIPGQAHVSYLGVNRARFNHVMREFLTMPARADGGAA